MSVELGRQLVLYLIYFPTNYLHLFYFSEIANVVENGKYEYLPCLNFSTVIDAFLMLF